MDGALYDGPFALIALRLVQKSIDRVRNSKAMKKDHMDDVDVQSIEHLWQEALALTDVCYKELRETFDSESRAVQSKGSKGFSNRDFWDELHMLYIRYPDFLKQKDKTA